MTVPTLSVVLAARNEERWLPQQLAAIGPQLTAADEWLLVDDGSTDGTGILLDGVPMQTAATVRTWRRATPAGAIPTYNAAAAEATGDWIYLASGNDVLLPGAIAAWREAATLWPTVPLVAGQAEWWTLALDTTTPRPPRMLPACLPPSKWVTMLQGAHLYGAAVFVRRAVWEERGGYDAALQWLADYWLYHDLVLSHGAVWLAQPLVAIHTLPGQLSYGYMDPGRMQAVLAALEPRLQASPARARWLATTLLDEPHAGAGAARRWLEARV